MMRYSEVLGLILLFHKNKTPDDSRDIFALLNCKASITPPFYISHRHCVLIYFLCQMNILLQLRIMLSQLLYPGTLHFIRQSFLFRSELRFHSDKSKSWITQNQVFRIKFFAHFKAAFPHGQETQAYKTIQGYLCYIVEKVQNCVRICIYSNERSLRIVNSQHHNQGKYRSAKF